MIVAGGETTVTRNYLGKTDASQRELKPTHREEIAMLKSIMIPATALSLAVAAWLVLPLRGHDAVADTGPLYINAVDLDIQPGQIDQYLALLKVNGAASVKEPGCHEFDITVSQKDPNHVFIFEVYDNAAALEAHRQTDHFKKYAAATKDMVTKREPRALSSVAMNMKGM
ncbi:MAG TPA: putative quinol monooxygenase [Xanthobacteraceae bacterium]|nr:putative quinol monooxygenase [Xanthobacteraceae bacterium]